MPAETHYRMCDGLLNLQRSNDLVIFRTACETALRYGRYSYSIFLFSNLLTKFITDSMSYFFIFVIF